MSLDIAFSDHRMSRETLKAFGEVIHAIHQVCDDDPLRFWSFIHYVSTRHPEVLGVEISAEQRERCEDVITRANPPPVIYKESERARLLEHDNETGGHS